MKKYSEFLTSMNESSGKNWVDVFNASKPFDKPAYQVHKSEILEEVENLLKKKERGILKNVTVFADIPTLGNRKPEYLADVLPPVKRTRTREDRPEGEEPEDKNVFVDVEFDVVEIDHNNNMIVAMPNSLKRKGITTPINPKDVLEIMFTRSSDIDVIPTGMRKGINMATNKNISNDPTGTLPPETELGMDLGPGNNA
jgi:hypothetical protein